MSFGKGVTETGGRFLLLLAAPLLLKSIFRRGVTRVGKSVIRAGREYNNMDDIENF